jgi:hypothetical protein
MSIADSVVNRILNLRDDLASDRADRAQPSLPKLPPSVTDPALESGAINAALVEPVQTADVGGELDPMTAGVAQGSNLLDGVL